MNKEKESTKTELKEAGNWTKNKRKTFARI